MRGHVTKINFTNRRHRKAEARTAETTATRTEAGMEDQGKENGQSAALPLLEAASYYAQLCIYATPTIAHAIAN